MYFNQKSPKKLSKEQCTIFNIFCITGWEQLQVSLENFNTCSSFPCCPGPSSAIWACTWAAF